MDVAGIRSLAAKLAVLAERGPERLTLSQAAFFLEAAASDLVGKPETFSTIRDKLGGAVNRSLHTTYKVFVDEGRNRDGKREPGLGWLTRVTDPQDNRRKYLKLTPSGHEIIRIVLA